MDLNQLKRDSQGRWIDNLAGADPKWRFRVRGFSAPEVRSFIAWRHRHVVDGERLADGTLSFEAEDAITLEALHRVVLLEWQGLELGGAPLKYSAKNAERYITDPDYRALADIVAAAALAVDADEAARRERLEKN
jgi:hypothetical protein